MAETKGGKVTLHLIEGGINRTVVKTEPCPYQPTCPITQGAGEDAPIAAAYVLITEAGEVVDGAYKIKPHHLNDVILALDRLKANLEEKEREWGL